MTKNEEGFHEVVVARASNGRPEFRKGAGSVAPKAKPGEHFGWGSDLQQPAWNEILQNLNSEHYEIGEHVATIHYNLDSYEYDIDYHVKLNTLKRIKLNYGQRIFEFHAILSGVLFLVLIWQLYNIYAVSFVLLLSIGVVMANHIYK